VTDRCAGRADPAGSGVRVVLQRLPTPDAAQSDLDARILSATLYRGDEFLWRYEFDLETEYYYWAGIVGERLYFVGNYVKYMGLGTLVTGEHVGSNPDRAGPCQCTVSKELVNRKGRQGRKGNKIFFAFFAPFAVHKWASGRT